MFCFFWLVCLNEIEFVCSWRSTRAVILGDVRECSAAGSLVFRWGNLIYRGRARWRYTALNARIFTTRDLNTKAVSFFSTLFKKGFGRCSECFVCWLFVLVFFVFLNGYFCRHWWSLLWDYIPTFVSHGPWERETSEAESKLRS